MAKQLNKFRVFYDLDGERASQVRDTETPEQATASVQRGLKSTLTIEELKTLTFVKTKRVRV